MAVAGQVNHLLIHTLEHQRKVRVSQGKGVFKDVPTTIGTVIGRVNPASSKEVLIGEQHQAKVSHAIYLETGADSVVNDEYIFNGRRFRVTVAKLIPSVDIYTKVLAEEVQHG